MIFVGNRRVNQGKSADSAEIHQDDQNKLRKNTELRCDSKGKPDRSDGGRRFVKAGAKRQTFCRADNNAAASNAIIVGFQVRPSASARRLAEKEEIEIRLYSIIYDAINDIKDAIEGMLEPVMKEEIVASVEVLEIFKITKVGTVAGCMVREGKLQRSTPIRVIRDGIVIYTGKLGSLKRFKDDVKEVVVGQDCGLNIESFNDIRVGDIVEGYEQVEVKRK